MQCMRYKWRGRIPCPAHQGGKGREGAIWGYRGRERERVNLVERVCRDVQHLQPQSQHSHSTVTAQPQHSTVTVRYRGMYSTCSPSFDTEPSDMHRSRNIERCNVAKIIQIIFFLVHDSGGFGGEQGETAQQ